MNKLQEQFLELLRSGLWGTPAETALFNGKTDWAALYHAALQQTVPGILLDGLETLPRELRPERQLYLQWCTQVLHVEEQNELLDRRIGELVSLLRAEGIDPVLMKGQGVARNYRNPEHRSCGDIDLYIGREHFETVNRLLLQEAKKLDEDNYKHTSTEWRGVHVENHQFMAVLNAPGGNRFLQREIARWHGQTPARQLRIAQTDVTLMPVDFECVYLLVHALRHFMTEGIGLRQISDWACLLKRHADSLHPDEVQRLLKGTGLRPGAGALASVVTRYLGLPEPYLPFTLNPQDTANGDVLWQDIWSNGNFGLGNSYKQSRPKGRWRGKWHTFRGACTRALAQRRILGQEAYWQPVGHLRNFLQAQRYQHRKKQ